MRSPESSLDMRKSELSSEVKSYVENLTVQINEVPRELGLKSLQDMLDALDQDNVAFEQDAVRRDRIVDAAEKLSKLIELRRHAKDTGELPEPEKKDNKLFDPDNWNPEDFTAAKFLKENMNKIESREIEVFAQMIGGKDVEELIEEMHEVGIKTTEYSQSLLQSPYFTTRKDPEELILIRLTVRDLGFKELATTDEIYKRAVELGLELCPAEVGPHYRLSYPDQPLHDYVAVGMEPISDQDGSPSVFFVSRHPDGLFLHARNALPERGWHAGGVHFLFRLRKNTD